MNQVEEIKKYVADGAFEAISLEKEIFGYAELSYTEVKSAAALVKALKQEGFEVVENIADIPTAFKASYSVGTGKPVMALLAEYDALDGLSQEAGCAVRTPIIPNGSGHGCGHNLLGVGSLLAAVAVKNYLVNNRKDGTIVLYGTPAEEGAGSKQFIARAGEFEGVDFCYAWHPGQDNAVQSTGSVAIIGANFVFDGIASHAGGSPHLGRSALDACELMNVGCNYLREHMIDQARIHYAYSNAGGTAPNVVQDHAIIKYEVRAPKVSQMKELFERVVDCARGAALMTGTKMNYEITMAFSDYTPNVVLSKIMSEALEACGAPEWTEEDYALASALLHTFPETTLNAFRETLLETHSEEEADEIFAKPLSTETFGYDPLKFKYQSGSTDVGDVGYAVPTTQLRTVTCCEGCVGHSWQMTAFSGSEIGAKGMLKAAEIMALSCVMTMDRPDAIEAAKKELLKKNGGKYECPLPASVLPPIGKY